MRKEASTNTGESEESEAPRDADAVNWVAIAAWMRLARVYQQIDRRSAEAFRVHGLTVAQFDVIAQVGAHPGCLQQELADRLLVTKGNVTQLLAKMEARGLIERRHAPHGRGNLLFLTEEGTALRATVVPEQAARIADLFSALPDLDLHHLNRMLRVLDRLLA